MKLKLPSPAMVVALIALTVHLPFGFGLFPQVDEGEMSVSITAPPGTSLAATQQIVTQVGNLVRGLPEMKEVKWTVSDRVFYKPGTWFKSHTESQKGFVFSVVGSDQPGMMGGNQGPQYGYLSAKVVDKQHRSRGISEIVEVLRQRTAHIPGAERIAVSVSSGSGMSNNIQKEVQGTSFGDMLKEAEQVAGVMRGVPGAVDVDISYKPDRPERRIVVDRVRATQLGLSVAQIGSAARTAIDGNDSVELRDSGTEYPIRVRYGDAREMLGKLPDALLGSCDLLVIDVFSGARIPAHVTSVEFYREAVRLEPERAALMRQITLAQREVRSWPVWMTARATMPKWMMEWDD